MGLVAPWHVGSSKIRNWTHDPCIGRWIVHHPANSENLNQVKLSLSVSEFKSSILAIWSLADYYEIIFCIMSILLDFSSPSFVPLILAAQSCLTLCDPMDTSPSGFSAHGILQAGILEWVAIPFSRGLFLTQGSNPGLLHCSRILYWLSHQGSPILMILEMLQ